MEALLSTYPPARVSAIAKFFGLPENTSIPDIAQYRQRHGLLPGDPQAGKKLERISQITAEQLSAIASYFTGKEVTIFNEEREMYYRSVAKVLTIDGLPATSYPSAHQLFSLFNYNYFVNLILRVYLSQLPISQLNLMLTTMGFPSSNENALESLISIKQSIIYDMDFFLSLNGRITVNYPVLARMIIQLNKLPFPSTIRPLAQVRAELGNSFASLMVRNETVPKFGFDNPEAQQLQLLQCMLISFYILKPNYNRGEFTRVWMAKGLPIVEATKNANLYLDPAYPSDAYKLLYYELNRQQLIDWASKVQVRVYDTAPTPNPFNKAEMVVSAKIETTFNVPVDSSAVTPGNNKGARFSVGITIASGHSDGEIIDKLLANRITPPQMTPILKTLQTSISNVGVSVPVTVGSALPPIQAPIPTNFPTPQLPGLPSSSQVAPIQQLPGLAPISQVAPTPQLPGLAPITQVAPTQQLPGLAPIQQLPGLAPISQVAPTPQLPGLAPITQVAVVQQLPGLAPIVPAPQLPGLAPIVPAPQLPGLAPIVPAPQLPGLAPIVPTPAFQHPPPPLPNVIAPSGFVSLPSEFASIPKPRFDAARRKLMTTTNNPLASTPSTTQQDILLGDLKNLHIFTDKAYHPISREILLKTATTGEGYADKSMRQFAANNKIGPYPDSMSTQELAKALLAKLS